MNPILAGGEGRYPSPRFSVGKSASSLIQNRRSWSYSSCRIETTHFQGDALGALALRDVHDHAREQIKASLDRIEQDVFRIGGVGAVTLQAEPLDDRRLGIERGEGGVGAASFRHFIHDEFLAELTVNLLRVFAECP